MIRIRGNSFVALMTVVLMTVFVPFTSHGQSKFVTTRGKEFIAPNGKPLFLKGIDLGNWLLAEGYTPM